MDPDEGGFATPTATVSPGERDDDGDGYSEAAGDCDDTNPSQYPQATESCNQIDDDCDGAIDSPASAQFPRWYQDSDHDGFGNAQVSVQSCEAPTGYVASADDCNDSNAAIYPQAPEVECSSNTDFNCDGHGGQEDFDEDGYPGCQDCSDTNAAIHPEGEERCNALDDDCDGETDEVSVDGSPLPDSPTWYLDADGDGYGNAAVSTVSCAQPEGYTSQSGDCNLSDPSIHPGATEVCNGRDEDCDEVIDDDASDASTWYQDADDDGYGVSGTGVKACSAPIGTASQSGDCDDHNPSTNPGAAEQCDDKDNDCDGVSDDGVKRKFYRDEDNDGYGDESHTTYACTQPAGYASQAGDCDDEDPAVNPGAVELCNAFDDNCDGKIDMVKLSDGTYASACNNHALSFKGKQVVSLNGDGLDFEAFTLQVWVKTTDCTSDVCSFETSFIAEHRCDSENGFNLGIINEGQALLQVESVQLTSDNLINDGIWHEVSGTFDGAEAVLYVDAIEAARTDVILESTKVVPLLIGASGGDTGHLCGFSTATLDEIRIWDQALSAQDIKAYYKVPLSQYQDLPVWAYFDFHEGSGQVTSDLGPDSHDGELGNSHSSDPNDPTWVTDTTGPF